MSASLIGWLLGKMGIIRPGHPASRIFMILFGAVLFLFFTPVAVVLVSSKLSEAWESGKWPSTEGTVLSADVQTKGFGTKIKYVPAITYEYQVDGHKYSGNRTRIGSYGFGSESDASDYVSEHSVGDRVSVYYQPSDPSRSLLEAGMTGRASAYLLIPLLVAGLGIFFILAGRKSG